MTKTTTVKSKKVDGKHRHPSSPDRKERRRIAAKIARDNRKHDMDDLRARILELEDENTRLKEHGSPTSSSSDSSITSSSSSSNKSTANIQSRLAALEQSAKMTNNDIESIKSQLSLLVALATNSQGGQTILSGSNNVSTLAPLPALHSTSSPSFATLLPSENVSNPGACHPAAVTTSMFPIAPRPLTELENGILDAGLENGSYRLKALASGSMPVPAVSTTLSLDQELSNAGMGPLTESQWTSEDYASLFAVLDQNSAGEAASTSGLIPYNSNLAQPFQQ